MLDCGDPQKMGYKQYYCPNCDISHKVAFTCKCSFCLTCAKVYADNWVDKISTRLFTGVTYRHLTFTMPDFLTLHFYRNPEIITDFMRLGYECLKDIFKKCARKNIDIGCVMVIHTGGRKGNYNPHLHILVTSGGILDNGSWENISYINYDMVHKKWQYHLLKFLKEKLPKEIIQKDVDKAYKKYPNGFHANVDSRDVPPEGRGLAKYLAKYLTSPPIALRRIISYDGKNVCYWFNDHKTQKVQEETVPVLIFIGRMVQNILPKAFHRVRYYGLHGNNLHKKSREVLLDILPEDNKPIKDGYTITTGHILLEKIISSKDEPPKCKICDNIMLLDLIYYPKYGKKIILNYGMKKNDRGTKNDKQKPTPAPAIESRPMDRSEAMAQVSMPFL